MASDPQSLAKYLKFDFLVGMIICHEILNKVNKISKVLLKKDMNIDDAISLINGVISFFEEYRKRGFDEAMIEAEKLLLKWRLNPNFVRMCSFQK
ncbi:hypothetical protein Dsin_012333 [Dipteronia sinensis]|uniref:Uncharacterized protein n=1 Tax=Dipteronia sinensis TaxID=43782 RepID=A0AAE0E7V1_9ROSI|nr:hypothetical protein Dsin_012333 [Dipteronia sinensis]